MRVRDWAGKILALAITFAIVAPASAVVFPIQLSGDQEVPPVATTVSGVANLILNDAEDELFISILVDGLNEADITGAHIHNAPAGSNGPIVFGFIGTDNDSNGDTAIQDLGTSVLITTKWDATEGNGTTLADQLDNLKDSLLYINIHTAANTGGEIRGQIPEPASMALLGMGSMLLFASRKRK